MSQTIILQSEDVLVIERDDPTSIVTTEIETVLVVEETEQTGIVHIETETVLLVETEVTVLMETEIETVLVVEDIEVTVLEVAEQGPAGPGGGALTTINFSFGDAARVIALSLMGRIVSAVNINVATPFNGVGASLSIGTLTAPNLLVAPTQLDLSVATEFEIKPNVKFQSPTDIYLTITPGAGATQGAGWLVLETAIFN